MSLFVSELDMVIEVISLAGSSIAITLGEGRFWIGSKEGRGALLTGSGWFNKRALGIGVLTGSLLGGSILTMIEGTGSCGVGELLSRADIMKLRNQVSGLEKEAVVGAVLGIWDSVLKEISSKRELGKEFLQGEKSIIVVSSLYRSKKMESSRSSSSN
ncbi:21976_t:CDS:2 [Gigaspora margarita]|uniref:21976_t:CDS:1 n=1 Tax=Gigaspora margarita TaxID=4874 RepID=A0ABN7UJR3_GIGMA|nr:21976_t:CDS:2 [Gigaspora margarita]